MSLNRARSLGCLSNVFFPNYNYSAVTLSLSVKDTTTIHKTFMLSLLNRLGFQATIPRSVAFAPKQLVGIGITPMNVIITQRKVKFMYRHLCANKELGKALLINLQWAIAQAGRLQPIFKSDYRINYIENPWLIQLHNSLRYMT